MYGLFIGVRKLNPKLRLLFISVISITTLVYALWYFCSDYQQLSDWYKGLNPYFYKARTWDTFFTTTVKSQGNWWCIAAIISVSLWTFLAIKTPVPVFPKLNMKGKSVLTYTAIALGGIALSLLAMRHALHASDEVLSAVDFASLPAFQRISYYILPNNHLLFNFINGFFSGFEDNVQTGRIISMLCYIGVLCSTWYFIKKWLNNTWLSIAILLLVAVQLPVWGFSVQARGYEMVLLCSVVSFVSFWSYWVACKRYFLIIHSVSLVAGMLTLPTFLYWWFGLLIAAVVLQIRNRQFDKVYFSAMLASFSITMVLLLPALSFSGLGAFTENGYVKGSSETILNYFTHLNADHYFNGLFNEWFYSGSTWVGIFYLSLPIILFISYKNDKRYFTLLIIYLSLISSFIIMAVLMQKLPFYRNLISHNYLVVIFVTIAIASILQSKGLQIIYAVTLLIGAGYSLNANYERRPTTLYYYDVRETIDNLEACKIRFKPRKSIYLDDESFYWWYIIRNSPTGKTNAIQFNRASFKMQDYCIMPREAMPPVSDTMLYKRKGSCGEFDIFEKILER